MCTVTFRSIVSLDVSRVSGGISTQPLVPELIGYPTGQSECADDTPFRTFDASVQNTSASRNHFCQQRRHMSVQRCDAPLESDRQQPIPSAMPPPSHPRPAGIKVHDHKRQGREHDSPTESEFGYDGRKHPAAKEEFFDTRLKDKTRQKSGNASETD
jgi:hypothetical protein